MNAQLRSAVGSVAASPAYRNAAPYHTAPWTTDERLQRIVAMSQQINGYIEFISQLGDLHGTSGEAREKAVAAFYERMTIFERQLARIHDELKLG